ncbi:efflux RND transporter permease subunit [Planctomycetaceae bacterium SH139]
MSDTHSAVAEVGSREFESCEASSSDRPWRKLSWVILLLWLASVPWVLYHAKLAWDGNSNRVEDWIPMGHPETVAQDRFVELFGSDELLAATWQGCTLDDRSLVRLSKLVAGPSEAANDSQVPTDSLDAEARALSVRLNHYFRRVLIGNEVFAELQDSGIGMSPRAALARMHGWILGSDGQQTGAIGLVSMPGMLDRQAAVAAYRDAMVWAAELPAEDIYIAGPTIESVAIDQASRDGLMQLSLLSFLIAGVVVVAVYRDLRVGSLLLLIALYNEHLALAVVSISGGRTDAVLLLMANVTFILSISAGCHLMRYFREALLEHGPQRAPVMMLRAAVRPIALATITSAIGFGSLASSQIIPIQNFGIYAGVMILLSGCLVPTFVFASYTVLPAGGWYRKLQQTEAPESQADQRLSGEFPTALLVGISQRWRWVIPLFLACLIGGAMGLPRLTASLGMKQMFPEDAKVLQDYRWIEEHLTPLVPIEIVLSPPPGPAGEQVDWLGELGIVNQVAQAARKCEALEIVISPLNFMSNPPLSGSGFRYAAKRNIFQSNFHRFVDDLQGTGALRVVDGARHWRISGRMRATAEHDYAGVQAEVQRAVKQALDELDASATVSFQVSGGALIFERMQKLLLRDMGISLLVAVGLIAIVMSLVLRNPVVGLVSLLPNVIPPVFIFGMMGWLEWPLEIGSVLTASAAIGVAVDDTLHLIYAYARRGGGASGEGTASDGGGIDQPARIAAALQHCGPAMVQTTLVCCLGMLVFAGSHFTPIVRFASVIAILLSVALVCDLLLLPALLASPLGRRFAR